MIALLLKFSYRSYVELSGAVDWEEFAEFYPSGTINLRITRNKFIDSLQAWLYQEETGIDMSAIVNPESNTSKKLNKDGSDRKDRSFVSWPKLIKTYELKPKDSMFKEKALEIFEKELTTFIADRETNKKVKTINKADKVEIPQNLIIAVNNAYLAAKEERDALDAEGNTVKGRFIEFATLVGLVAREIKAEPEQYAEMMAQIRAYQMDNTAGFTPPRKGRAGGITKVVPAVEEKPAHAPVAHLHGKKK